jgi:oligopeptide transport system ATP-binding protein
VQQKSAMRCAKVCIMTTEQRLDAVHVEALCKTFRSGGARSKRHDEIHAVRNVSLAVGRGECLGIAGESGSGKSTLARMLVGLEVPTSGTFLVNGEQLAEPPKAADRRHHARRIQMVFQDPYSSLDPRQPVGMVLDEVQRVHFDRDRGARARRTTELLDAVGLGANYNEAVPRSLSGGQRQRLAIARALAAEPSVMVLDEAVSALDVSIQAQILNLLSDLREELSLTYIFISHDLAVIRQVADRVLVLYRGELMEQAPVEEIFDTPAHPYTRLLLDSVPRPGMPLARRGERAVSQEGGCLFRERCARAHPRCEHEPPLFSTSANSQSRCWLVEERSSAVLIKEEE